MPEFEPQMEIDTRIIKPQIMGIISDTNETFASLGRENAQTYLQLRLVLERGSLRCVLDGRRVVAATWNDLGGGPTVLGFTAEVSDVHFMRHVMNEAEMRGVPRLDGLIVLADALERISAALRDNELGADAPWEDIYWQRRRERLGTRLSALLPGLNTEITRVSDSLVARSSGSAHLPN